MNIPYAAIEPFGIIGIPAIRAITYLSRRYALERYMQNPENSNATIELIASSAKAWYRHTLKPITGERRDHLKKHTMALGASFAHLSLHGDILYYTVDGKDCEVHMA
jgi:hypothetical protein